MHVYNGYLTFIQSKVNLYNTLQHFLFWHVFIYIFVLIPHIVVMNVKFKGLCSWCYSLSVKSTLQGNKIKVYTDYKHLNSDTSFFLYEKIVP